MKRPHPSEYAEYYGTYTNQVPDGDVFQILAEQVGRPSSCSTVCRRSGRPTATSPANGASGK